MLTTLACVVFIASIIVFFSEELRNAFIGMLKNRKFQIIAPLFLLSWFVIYHEPAVMAFLVLCGIGLYYIVYEVSKILPWVSEYFIVMERIIILFFIPVFLLGLTDLILCWIKSQKNVRRIVLFVCTFLWVLAVFLMMIRYI